MLVLSCSLLFKKTINNHSSTDMRCVVVTFTSLYILIEDSSRCLRFRELKVVKILTCVCRNTSYQGRKQMLFSDIVP